MSKLAHLIRHGESTFNAAYRETGEDPIDYDAPLSPTGHRQVALGRAAFDALAIDLVVTSPFTRTIQTALGLFGHRDVAIVVEALHCERLGASCDIGRPPAALRAAFPDLAFDHLDDPWWYVDGTASTGFEIPASGRGGPIGTTFGLEPMTRLQTRIAAFRDWLKARPEPAIAAVGHATFFAEMTGHMMQNCEYLSVEI
jgi:broad specificity phosphatase PhoE